MLFQNSKPRSLPKTLAAAITFACLACVSTLATDARAAARLLQPSTDHCISDDMTVLTGATAGSLSPDERRVVLWLVHQILSAEDDVLGAEDTGSSRLEFTAAAVSAALGIDVRALDRQRIQEHVRATLVGHSCQQALELLD